MRLVWLCGTIVGCDKREIRKKQLRGEGPHRRKIEITRRKGLGEISPKEFAQFIGKEMRLSKVEYASKPKVVPIGLCSLK